MDALDPDKAVHCNGTSRRTPVSKSTPTKPKRNRTTFHISKELVDGAHWTPNLTAAEIVEMGLRTEGQRPEKQRSEPLPQLEKALVGGKPIES